FLPTVKAVMFVLHRIKERIELSCERLGLTYPWWIPAYSTLACIALTVTAFAQRGSDIGSPPVIAAFPLTLAPLAFFTMKGWLAPPWVEAVALSVAVALYLSHPVQPDIAPLLLLISAGEIAATMKSWIAMAIATVDVTILVIASATGHLQSAALYVIGVIL